MSHTIGAAAKLTTEVVYGTHLNIHTNIQTALRALANGDKIISIDVVRKSAGNKFMAIITYEDQ
tara:strand:- start:187 stop:378 length:192 start_codon:yes stop_codon:yes gene_type:complete